MGADIAPPPCKCCTGLAGKYFSLFLVFFGNFIVEDHSADCAAFPCPRGLDSWSGETSALYIYNEENEEVYAVAYWE